MRLWPPHERAPEFIKGNLSIHVVTFAEWASQHTDAKGFVKLDLKESRDKTLYLSLNTWKKDEPPRDDTKHQDEPRDERDAIPF